MGLHNRRMIPQRVLESGYRFHFPDTKDELVKLFPKEAV